MLLTLVLVPLLIITVAAIFRQSADFSVVETPVTVPSLPPPPSPPPPVEEAPDRNPELQQLLDRFAASVPVPVAIVVKDLGPGGTAASVDAGRGMISASLYKLFVAVQILRLVDSGQLSLTGPAGGGTDRSIGGCLEIMINISDNGCGVALGNKLGWGQQNAALAEAGYLATRLNGVPRTSAGDVGLWYERLQAGTLLSPDSSSRLLAWLKDQRVINRLPTGLPAGIEIAHKTGDLYGYLHDAGVIYSPGATYLVVMMSGSWANASQGLPKFTELSSQLYAFFNQDNNAAPN